MSVDPAPAPEGETLLFGSFRVHVVRDAPGSHPIYLESVLDDGARVQRMYFTGEGFRVLERAGAGPWRELVPD